MASNPFAPPKAEVQDVVQGRVAPALWNPNAAANWSLLFSPVFGGLLQMKNWQALGEPEKASASKLWVIVSLLVLGGIVVASAVLPDTKAIDPLSRLAAIGLLFGWYFSSARKQAAYVRETFGKSYPRKGWTKPLLLAVAALVGYVVAAMLVGLAAAALRHEI